MIFDYQIDMVKSILGDKKGYSVCANHNLQVRGHFHFGEFEQLFIYCNAHNIVFTLGADGVLVVHD